MIEYKTVVGYDKYPEEFDTRMGKARDKLVKEQKYILNHHWSVGGGIIACVLEIGDLPGPQEVEFDAKSACLQLAKELAEVKAVGKPRATTKNKAGKSKTNGGEA